MSISSCDVQKWRKRCPSLPVIYKNEEKDVHLYLWCTKMKKRCPSLPVIHKNEEKYAHLYLWCTKMKKKMPISICDIQKWRKICPSLPVMYKNEEKDVQPYLCFSKINKKDVHIYLWCTKAKKKMLISTCSWQKKIMPNPTCGIHPPSLQVNSFRWHLNSQFCSSSP